MNWTKALNSDILFFFNLKWESYQIRFSQINCWNSVLWPSPCAGFCSHLRGPFEKDEFRRRQTAALSVPEGPSSCGSGDGCHPPRLRLPTTCGNEGPQTPGRLPRVLAEEPLGQQEETPPRWQPAGRRRQRDHLSQPGLTAARELRSR